MSAVEDVELDLVGALRGVLAESGHAGAVLDESTLSAATWRAAARAAARALGRPVQTAATSDGRRVSAALADWPSTPAEEERQLGILREAGERVDEYLATLK